MNSKEIVGSVFAVALKIIIAVILIMLVYKYAIQGYEYGYRIFGEPAMTTGEGRTVTITVNEGDSVKNIAQTLETNGLVREAKLFELQEKVSEYKNMLQPGVYELNTSMTAEEMMAVMAEEPQSQESTQENPMESESESLEGTLATESE